MVVYPQYEEEMVRVISRISPQLRISDIRKAVRYSINKRYRPEQCKLNNNYTKTTSQNTLLEIAEWINERQPICTAYGVLFKRKGKKPHPLIALIRSLLSARDADKALMFKYLELHDYENVAIYQLAQILDKRNANSIYGCLGNSSCVLYNLYVAASITLQGRAAISTATLFFESFLANNVNFGSLEEVLHFIDNVCSEKPNRKCDDNVVLDRNISFEECFIKVMKGCIDWRKGRVKWIPSYRDGKIIYDTLSGLSQEDINRIYYKNNLYAFTDNSMILSGIKYILKKLNKPYLAPNEVPEEISVELDTLQEFYREYVYYPHMYIDRIDRNANMIKDVSVISDTDSTIVSFDAWYHFILNRIMGEDIPITRMEYDMLKDQINQVPQKELRYDFYTDEVIESESLIKPFVLIPQNNVRFSIINIISYISGNLCNEYIENFTKSNHSWKEDEKCKLYLKNEFLFSRALLTDVKKFYATNVELQEGHIIEQNRKQALNIKGLPINKTTLNEYTKDALQQILYEDILTAENIDQKRIMEKIAILEKQIEQSLANGEKNYYKPLVVKAASRYENPMTQQGIKASIVWNKLRDDGLEALDLNARNTIDVVKVKITPSNIDIIKDEYPETYQKLIDLFMDTSFFPDPKKKKEIDTIAIPIDVETPKWITKFIDYNTIIDDNISNFPFKSIGIRNLGSSATSYSPIMQL